MAQQARAYLEGLLEGTRRGGAEALVHAEGVLLLLSQMEGMVGVEGHAQVLSALDDLKRTRRRLHRFGWLVEACNRLQQEDLGPPASGGAFGQALARETGGDVIYDWGGGLIWAALPPAADAHATLLRQRLKSVGGHATLLRATDQVRNTVDVFHPQEAGVAALGQRVKASFDPRNILNRGRMVRA